MPSTKKVGTSVRTPFKHKMLHDAIGRAVGVLCNGSVRHFVSMKSVTFVDMCAGDGEVKETGECSPFILLKHAAYCNWTSKRHGLYRVPPTVHLVEKDQNTIRVLKRNLEDRFLMLPHYAHLHQMDASKFSLPVDDPLETRFINLDPNSVSSMPSPDSWGDMLTSTSFLMMTLGCNPAGSKRTLTPEESAKWFSYVNEVTRWYRRDHERFDLYFVSLTPDSHQWAYLFNFPRKWGSTVMGSLKKAAALTLPGSLGVEVMSYRDQRAKFDREVERHFRTKKDIEVRGWYENS